MKVLIFGQTISSAWGEGRATLWRGRVRALIERSADVVFFERDAPNCAYNRDLREVPGGALLLYEEWCGVRSLAARHLRDADVAVVTSYCPDALAAGECVCLHSPVKLARLKRGESVDYLGPNGYCDYDLVMSYAGGSALEALQNLAGAGRTGHVDPSIYSPAEADSRFRAELSDNGAYTADRKPKVDALLLAPAPSRGGR